MNLTHGELFAGIGGLGLGVSQALGTSIRWFVEIDSFCQRVLASRFPGVPIIKDVRDACATESVSCVNLDRVDVITGGFPCTDTSVAGKGAGVVEGEHSGLWREYRRIVACLDPSVVIVENVPGLRTRGLEVVVTDLAALGYDVAWDVLAAAHVGAPHLRRRLFIVAWRTAFADANRRELRQQLERVTAGWAERGLRRVGGKAVSRDNGEGGDDRAGAREAASGGRSAPDAERAGLEGPGGAGDEEPRGTSSDLSSAVRDRMLPTPTAADSKNSGGRHTSSAAHPGVSLTDVVVFDRQLPTPTANDAKNASLPPSQRNRDSLAGSLLRGELLPTPTTRASDQGAGHALSSEGAPNLITVVSSSEVESGTVFLHPRFVEWMQGFPLGWTDLDDDDDDQ